VDECAQLPSLLAESVQLSSLGSASPRALGFRWCCYCACPRVYSATSPAFWRVGWPGANLGSGTAHAVSFKQRL